MPNIFAKSVGMNFCSQNPEMENLGCIAQNADFGRNGLKMQAMSFTVILQRRTHNDDSKDKHGTPEHYC